MPYALAQKKLGTPAVGPVTTTFDAGPTQGNLLLAATYDSSNATTPTVSDANGNWTLLNSGTRVGSGLYLFGKLADPSQPSAVSGVRSTDVIYLDLYEFTGAPYQLSGIVDGTPGAANGSGATTTAGSQPSTTAVLPGDLVFTQLGTSNSVTSPSLSDGTFTLGQANAAGAIVTVEYFKLLGAAGTTYNPSFSWTTSRGWIQITTLLKRRSGGIFL